MSAFFQVEPFTVEIALGIRHAILSSRAVYSDAEVLQWVSLFARSLDRQLCRLGEKNIPNYRLLQLSDVPVPPKQLIPTIEKCLAEKASIPIVDNSAPFPEDPIIKAIETHYNGYRFRSRTEARWAVFLDAAGIAYEYESEGFELANGDWYLPDFHLVNDDLWLEVKGKQPTKEEIRKCWLLAEGFGAPVLIASRQPAIKKQVSVINTKYDDIQGPFSFYELMQKPPDDPVVQRAYSAARGARFEFGENGKQTA